MARKKKIEMEIINHNAAGIDVGSKSHFVAVGQDLEDVSIPPTNRVFQNGLSGNKFAACEKIRDTVKKQCSWP